MSDYAATWATGEFYLVSAEAGVWRCNRCGAHVASQAEHRPVCPAAGYPTDEEAEREATDVVADAPDSTPDDAIGAET